LLCLYVAAGVLALGKESGTGYAQTAWRQWRQRGEGSASRDRRPARRRGLGCHRVGKVIGQPLLQRPGSSCAWQRQVRPNNAGRADISPGQRVLAMRELVEEVPDKARPPSQQLAVQPRVRRGSPHGPPRPHGKCSWRRLNRHACAGSLDASKQRACAGQRRPPSCCSCGRRHPQLCRPACCGELGACAQQSLC